MLNTTSEVSVLFASPPEYLHMCYTCYDGDIVNPDFSDISVSLPQFIVSFPTLLLVTFLPVKTRVQIQWMIVKNDTMPNVSHHHPDTPNYSVFQKDCLEYLAHSCTTIATNLSFYSNFLCSCKKLHHLLFYDLCGLTQPLIAS